MDDWSEHPKEMLHRTAEGRAVDKAAGIRRYVCPRCSQPFEEEEHPSLPNRMVCEPCYLEFMDSLTPEMLEALERRNAAAAREAQATRERQAAQGLDMRARALDARGRTGSAPWPGEL